MSHTKYHTEAFVVRSFERGEADRVFVLLSKDMGKIYGHAKSVRTLQSKHRFGLQPLSHVTVSLVRGKAGMRITHVLPHEHIYRTLAPFSQNVQVFQNILKLAERLMPNDEPAEEIFSILSSVSERLSSEIDPARVSAIEAGAALGILHVLGYVQHRSPFTDLATGALTMQNTYLESVTKNKNNIVREVNRALQASQL